MELKQEYRYTCADLTETSVKKQTDGVLSNKTFTGRDDARFSILRFN